MDSLADPKPDETIARQLHLKPLFIAILFLGSFLLFLIQPLFARLVLPVMGGSPSVWNTAMLFYQAALLAGYAYANFIQRLPLKRQWMLHLGLFGLAALTLPIGIANLGPADTGGAAAFWLLKLLAVSIGPVFVAVAAQAPLMQAWFARSPDPHANNPFFLYAASNAGSLAGLLCYPFLLEPFTDLGFQQRLWSAGYLVLLALIGWGGWLILKAGPRAPLAAPADTGKPISWRRRFHWLALAAVPSGLLLSTTTHLTTDIMAMPLLWVIPLSLYLISFIIVFSRLGPLATRGAVMASPFALLVFAPATMLVQGAATTVFGILGLLVLFVLAVALHGTLAEDRPAPAKLTEFYLWMSLGGVVGGLFPALIAPNIFDWVYEHPILLLMAALLVPARPLFTFTARLWTSYRSSRMLRIIVPALAAAIGLWIGRSMVPGHMTNVEMAGVVLLGLATLAAIGRPLLFTFVLACLMLALGGWQQIRVSRVEMARERSFFGIYTIHTGGFSNTRRLMHGTTLHGAQSLDPETSTVPLTYYARQSGVGRAMRAAPALYGPGARIGVVGMGTASLSCYAQPDQAWTFYEIDPLIVRLASNDRVFSFVSQCKPDIAVVLGDARLKLQETAANSFDILAVDAFSSDAIPLHLMTKEAFQTYMRTLSPEGVLLVHVSNRYLDLEPVVAAIAEDLGLKARTLTYQPDSAQSSAGETASIWIAITASDVAMQKLRDQGGYWHQIRPLESARAWTDNFASVIPVLKPFM